MRTQPNKKKSWRISSGWWANARPHDFDALLNFANTQLQERNWADALWHAMGREKICTVTYFTNEGAVKKKMFAADVDSEDAKTEIKNDLPKISGGDASFQLAQQLQGKVKQVLDGIVVKADLVDRQRSGKEGTAWVEQLKTRDVGYKLTGQLSDYSNQPWDFSHSEDHDEIMKMIRKEFGSPETRRAVIHSTGFLHFDDEGEDAARTLSWMLTGLVDVVFQYERPILKKCQWCGRYFFHETLKRRKFCSDLCRYDSYNEYQRGEIR